ncbi:MAG: class D sortase [Anaerolineae bacterium]|nr:class D sortase [Gemmatimonadaceae bacterium]
MTRRAIGSALYVVGAGLLVYSAATLARSSLARDEARSAWEALEARQAVATVDASFAARASYAVVSGAPLARLIIPRIGLDEIVVEGVDGASLNAGPGHLPGSALPGEPGNSVVSAHRDRHFSDLDGVTVGDTLVTETLSGRVTWVVSSRRVVARGMPALYETPTAVLTLTTCWPVRYFGSAPDRLLIVARPVQRTPRA